MPVQERSLQALLHGHIHHLAVVTRSSDGRQHQQGVGCFGETTIAGRRPGHRRAVWITVPQTGPVAHAQFIAVIQAGHPWKAVEEPMQQPVGAWIAIKKRSQASVDAPVQPMAFGIGEALTNAVDDLLWHQVAIAEPELIVIAQR